MKALFDSNILIDALNGIGAATKEIERYPQALISIITWIEVLSGATRSDDASLVREYLSSFERIGLDPEIAERAAVLRRTMRLKLPDAIILATAELHHAILVTRDTGFGSGPTVRKPYTL